MRNIFPICLAAIMLNGCVGAALEGANIAKDKVIVSSKIDKANQGDPVAQYEVGKALCCSPTEDTSPFYNTKTSIAWLCASARQGYAPAMFKIGKIYSGDVVDGIRLIRRAAMGIAGSSRNAPVAYVWLRQASDLGLQDAAKRANSIWRELTPAERRRTTQLLQAGLKAKCMWGDVIEQRD
jgi:TPR repeat protein